ncbi:MAG TPA: hypothetical protein VFO60_01610, partial [Candidatus Dormibacteraeota bacterium]|nr:hypothetical protein [Candidatus Dormibacteraeota bacterium]
MAREDPVRRTRAAREVEPVEDEPEEELDDELDDDDDDDEDDEDDDDEGSGGSVDRAPWKRSAGRPAAQ